MKRRELRRWSCALQKPANFLRCEYTAHRHIERKNPHELRSDLYVSPSNSSGTFVKAFLWCPIHKCSLWMQLNWKALPCRFSNSGFLVVAKTYSRRWNFVISPTVLTSNVVRFQCCWHSRAEISLGFVPKGGKQYARST